MTTLLRQSRHQVAAAARRRGDGYLDALSPAIVERMSDGSIVFDTAHPAWRRAMDRHAAERARSDVFPMASAAPAEIAAWFDLHSHIAGMVVRLYCHVTGLKADCWSRRGRAIAAWRSAGCPRVWTGESAAKTADD